MAITLIGELSLERAPVFNVCLTVRCELDERGAAVVAIGPPCQQPITLGESTAVVIVRADSPRLLARSFIRG